MDLQTMNKQRKFVLIAAVVGLFSMFLSWGKISLFGYTAGSFKGTDVEYSFIPIACFIISGLIAFWGNQKQTLTTTNWFITLICGAVATLFTIWKFAAMPEGVTTGVGIYLAILSSLGILIAAFIFRSPTDNIKGGFDSLKKDISTKMNTGNTTPGTTNTGSGTDNPNSPL